MEDETPELTPPYRSGIPPQGVDFFNQIMDAMVPEEGDEAPGEDGAEVPPADDAGGQPAPADEGTPAAPAATPAPPSGDAGVGGVPAPTGAAVAETGYDPASLKETWGKVVDGLELNTAKKFQQETLAEVRAELPKYFEALDRHPRELVGAKVPSMSRSGEEEVLRDTEDAKAWQEAVEHALKRDVRARTEAKMQDSRGDLEILHRSVEMFQRNPDLLPGARGFDKELADRFASMVKDYEVRVDGKLRGYQIDVQPLIGQLRTQLSAERASRPAAPAAPKPPASKPDPQAGIQSRAGAASGEAEDFTQLFSTMGLNNFTI